MTWTPQNGTKTHPMSPAALRAMAALEQGPTPTSALNSGIVNRLLREGTVEIIHLPSPYKTHKGRMIPHVALRSGEAGNTTTNQETEND